MNTEAEIQERQLPDLVVLSDLHLGEGLMEDLGRYSPMEDFFSDAAFARLLDRLHAKYSEDPSRLVLVLNGDFLDFLTSISLPDRAACRALGLKVSEVEKKFGLDPSPKKSVFKLDLIVSGHKTFFGALARFVGKGHHVRILRGNHDLELHFEEVREHFLDLLTRFDGGPVAEETRERVHFHEWFYIEPGRLYIEHGNQYEASNSIRYPLRPLLPGKKKKKREVLLDYPLGSLFVRYFYNRVRVLDPYSPRLISFEQYLEFLRRYHIVDIFRVVRDHYPFFMAALRPQTATGRSRPSSGEDARQETDFRALEKESDPGDLYHRLNELKVLPMAASKMALTREMLKPIAKRMLLAAVTVLMTFYVWLVIFNLIQHTTWLAEKVLIRSAFMFLFSVSTVLGLLWIAHSLSHRLRRRTDESVETCAQRADQIARITGVRMVLMGHTHIVDLRRIADDRATYANSGTWTSVDNPWDRLVPEARRLTFLHVQGESVKVCRWNDDAGRIDPVPLFLLAEDRARERCPDDFVLLPVGARRLSRRRRSAYRRRATKKAPRQGGTRSGRRGRAGQK